MQIDQVVETPEGTLKFDGELTGDELKFVVEFALNVLLSRGTASLGIKPNTTEETMN